jgi:pSer/pThr/pTyr-binding forkhead associated (FHA) protein
MSLFDIAEAEAVAQQKKPRRQDPGVRFVLKFSHGQSVTVGNQAGVIGVKPVVEGEDVFRICVDDETDTVAPEHLEFGVDNGVFWVHDLKTVTGTVVEEPGSPAIQCIPYERYSLVRGSRVGLGELSFTLH